MKTLKRMQLEDLKNEMPLLDRYEILSIVGGGTEYIFNKSGQIISTRTGDDVEDRYCVSGCAWMDVDSGTTTITSGSNVGGEGRAGVLIQGGNKEMFEYFADNTDVEWGMSYKSGKKHKNDPVVMSTNYSTDSVDLVATSGYNRFVHSHPNNNTEASPNDQRVAYDYIKGNKSSNYDYDSFEIYTKKKNEYGSHYSDVDENPYA